MEFPGRSSNHDALHANHNNEMEIKMGQIDWAAVEKMSAANHALYTAAYEGNETQLAAALIDGADPRSVA